MSPVLQLYLVLMSKYSKFCDDIIYTFLVMGYIKFLFLQDADDDDNDGLAIAIARHFLRNERAKNSGQR